VANALKISQSKASRLIRRYVSKNNGDAWFALIWERLLSPGQLKTKWMILVEDEKICSVSRKCIIWQFLYVARNFRNL